MEKIIRKGIAFDKAQLRLFDGLIKRKGYKNRSEAIRDILRGALINEQEENPESRMMATLTMVYDHHEHNVQHELTHIEHHANDIIRSGLHVHLDSNNCLEVLILEGKVKEIKKLSEQIIATKGVKHGKLVMTAVQ
jgi:CopG family transcriptional regulator, nickel-responsive regulator